MKNNKAIYTIMLGHDPGFSVSYRVFKEYAKKVGADLHVCRSPHYDIGKDNSLSFAKAAWLQILYVQELLQDYERVLYIDADILITPHAEDIFAVCDREDVTYLFNEGEYLDCNHYLAAVDKFYHTALDWPVRAEKSVYFNTGVVLTSRQAGLFSKLSQADLQACYGRIPLYQQTHINYRLTKDQIPFAFLPASFNRMEYQGDPEQRFAASFIHYAGNGYSAKRRDRSWQLIEDYEKLYHGHTKLPLLKQLGYQLRFVFYYLERLYKRLVVRPLSNPRAYWRKRSTSSRA